ncbi:hypothetical protein QEN19_002967 [Hanseniaspora menglaensis]
MSSEFDSSDAEDEMLLSYVDSYRKQLAQKQQHQTQIKLQATQIDSISESKTFSPEKEMSVDLKSDLHIARGQVSVLKEKIIKVENQNKESKELFLTEKDQLESKYLEELETLKQEISKLNDEKDFLKQKLQQSKRQFYPSTNFSGNTSVDTQENKIVKKDEKASENGQTLSNTAFQLLKKKTDNTFLIEESKKTFDVKIETEAYDDVCDEEPINIKQKVEPPKRKKRPLLNFKTTLKFNDNYNLMVHLTKYKIPGMPETVIYYLDTESTSDDDFFKTNKLGSNLLSYGNDLVITETLSKFIELLLDFCLSKFNYILEMENEEDNKYIPFLLALIYQIITYRPSACDVEFLKNMFIVLFTKLTNFEYIFKLKSIYDPKLTMILSKYEVVDFSSFEGTSKNWISLGTETSLVNDENLFLKQHTSLLSTSYNGGNDFLMDEFEEYGSYKSRMKNTKHKENHENEPPDDHLFKVPNYNSEFLDFLIVVYTFDILETTLSNIDFLLSDLKEEENLNFNCGGFNELVDSYITIFKLSFTNSFQPLIQPLFNNVKMFSSIFSISCKLNLDLNKFVDLITVQCDWLLKINLKNYLHKLPLKYHVVSLKRYINGGENISYTNLITPLLKIMADQINYTPDCNKFIIIHKTCEHLSSNILKNMQLFLDKWFITYPHNSGAWIMSLDDAENSVISKILKSCTTLLTTNFLACQGSKAKKDLDLKRSNAVQCIKLLQLFQTNIDSFSDLLNSEIHEANTELPQNKKLKQVLTSSSQLANKNQTEADIQSIRNTLSYMNEKLSQLCISDESWKKELIVFTSRIIFQDQKNLLLKHELLKDFLRDLLDSLVTFDESEAIYDTLII